jgi:hypothetical protein
MRRLLKPRSGSRRANSGLVALLLLGGVLVWLAMEVGIAIVTGD